MQHLARPLLPRGVVDGGAECRAEAAKGSQVAAVALRAIAAAVEAVEQQAVEGAVLFVLKGQAVHIGWRRSQQAARRMGVLAVDQPGQLADATAFAETPREAQHHHLLGQRVALLIAGLETTARQRLTTDLLQPCLGRRRVTALLGIPAQVTQYRTGLDRGQLVLVAQQYQARPWRQGIEQVGHHFQVDHRRFVDHQHVQRQRVAGMVAEVPRTRAAAEQAVHGADLGGDMPAHLGADLQALDLLANGFGQTRGRLAGRRGQANAQRPALLHRRRLQQGQQAHHGSGLTRARAAGDDAEAGASGQGTGKLLPVHLASRRTTVEQLRQTARQVGRRRFGLGQALAQDMVDAPLVTPVTAQVQTLAAEHQRPRLLARGIPCGHQRAGGNALTPGVQVKVGQQLRGQQQGAGQGVAFRRQRQGKIGLGQGLLQVEADMAVAQLVAGQCGGQQQQGVATGGSLLQERYERTVQGTQPAPLYPAVEQLQEVAAVMLWRQGEQVLGVQRGGQQVDEASAHITAPANRSCCTGGCSPRNSASRLSISSRGGLV